MTFVAAVATLRSGRRWPAVTDARVHVGPADGDRVPLVLECAGPGEDEALLEALAADPAIASVAIAAAFFDPDLEAQP